MVRIRVSGISPSVATPFVQAEPYYPLETISVHAAVEFHGQCP